MIYVITIFLLLYLSYIYDVKGSVRNKDVWCCVVLSLIILISGLRYRLGVDTPNYLYKFYHFYPSLDKFSGDDWSLGNDPLFVLLNSFVKSIGGRFYHVQLIHSLFVNGLIFLYIKRHSKYVFTCLLFYFVFFFLNYNMQIMRGSMSIVLCLFAFDYVIKKKWIKACLLYFIGSMFHIQTLFVIIIPFLLFIRLNKVGLAFLVTSFFVGQVVQELLVDYLWLFEFNDAVETKANIYANHEEYGTQRENVTYVLIRIVPTILYVLISLWVVKKRNLSNDLLKLEPFVMIGLILLCLQLSLQIIYRFVDYLHVYFLLFYAEFFVYIAKKCKNIPRRLSFAKAMIVFTPLLVLWIWHLHYAYMQYYPYSSVFDRQIDTKREWLYKREDIPGVINKNEY